MDEEVRPLGLIVAELVINSLKHGFPDGAGGSIDVEYAARDAAGRCRSPTPGRPRRAGALSGGLGTSIVKALARQLRAELVLTDLTPGFMTSIVHSPPALGG